LLHSCRPCSSPTGRDESVARQRHPLAAPPDQLRSDDLLNRLVESRCGAVVVAGARQLHGCAVTSVVAPQVQGQATPGRDISTLAAVRVLRSRTPVPTWARRVVGEGVRSCPRALACRGAKRAFDAILRTHRRPPREYFRKQALAVGGQVQSLHGCHAPQSAGIRSKKP
jgi:hypothetical protein